MGKRRRPSPIFEEWEGQILIERLPDGTFAQEVQDAWARLWRDHIESEHFAATEVDDAALLCSLGWDIAFWNKEWNSAIARLERWFEHPQAESADHYTRICFRSWLAFTNLMAGKQIEAIGIYQQLLGLSRANDRRLARILMRNELIYYIHCCIREDRERVAPVAEVRLIAEFIEGCRGRKRLARTIKQGGATYGQLAEALEQAYPKTRG